MSLWLRLESVGTKQNTCLFNGISIRIHPLFTWAAAMLSLLSSKVLRFIALLGCATLCLDYLWVISYSVLRYCLDDEDTASHPLTTPSKIKKRTIVNPRWLSHPCWLVVDERKFLKCYILAMLLDTHLLYYIYVQSTSDTISCKLCRWHKVVAQFGWQTSDGWEVQV